MLTVVLFRGGRFPWGPALGIWLCASTWSSLSLGEVCASLTPSTHSWTDGVPCPRVGRGGWYVECSTPGAAASPMAGVSRASVQGPTGLPPPALPPRRGVLRSALGGARLLGRVVVQGEMGHCWKWPLPLLCFMCAGGGGQERRGTGGASQFLWNPPGHSEGKAGHQALQPGAAIISGLCPPEGPVSALGPSLGCTQLTAPGDPGLAMFQEPLCGTPTLLPAAPSRRAPSSA